MFSFLTRFFNRIKSVDEIVGVFTTMTVDLQECADRNQAEADRHYQLSLYHKDQQLEHSGEVAYAARVRAKINDFLAVV